MQSDLEGQIKKLSLAERILLVEEIWDSIARENETFELTEDQKKELDRRSKSFTGGRTWDEIRCPSSKLRPVHEALMDPPLNEIVNRGE